MSFKHSFILALVMACIVPFSACGADRLATEKLVFLASDGSPVAITAEIARTAEEQATGLMWRKSLDDGNGMLFWYGVDTRLRFWMKNTLIPLSIAYIDSSGVIREIYDMKPNDLSTVSSSISMRYALEVPAGWFSRVNLEPGCRLDAESLKILQSMR